MECPYTCNKKGSLSGDEYCSKETGECECKALYYPKTTCAERQNIDWSIASAIVLISSIGIIALASVLACCCGCYRRFKRVDAVVPGLDGTDEDKKAQDGKACDDDSAQKSTLVISPEKLDETRGSGAMITKNSATVSRLRRFLTNLMSRIRSCLRAIFELLTIMSELFTSLIRIIKDRSVYFAQQERGRRIALSGEESVVDDAFTEQDIGTRVEVRDAENEPWRPAVLKEAPKRAKPDELDAENVTWEGSVHDWTYCRRPIPPGGLARSLLGLPLRAIVTVVAFALAVVVVLPISRVLVTLAALGFIILGQIKAMYFGTFLPYPFENLFKPVKIWEQKRYIEVQTNGKEGQLVWTQVEFIASSKLTNMTKTECACCKLNGLMQKQKGMVTVRHIPTPVSWLGLFEDVIYPFFYCTATPFLKDMEWWKNMTTIEHYCHEHWRNQRYQQQSSLKSFEHLCIVALFTTFAVVAFALEIFARIYKVLINAWLIINATRNADALLRAANFAFHVPTLPYDFDALAEVVRKYATFMMIPWFSYWWDWLSERGTLIVERFAEEVSKLFLRTDMTCKGSQRSVYLLVNFFLVIGAIVLVESDTEFLLRLTYKRDYGSDATLWNIVKVGTYNSILDYSAAGIRLTVQLAISSMQLAPLMNPFEPASSSDVCNEYADGWLRGWNPDEKVSLVSFCLAWGFFFPYSCHSLLHTFVWGRDIKDGAVPVYDDKDSPRPSYTETMNNLDERLKGKWIRAQKERSPECPYTAAKFVKRIEHKGSGRDGDSNGNWTTCWNLCTKNGQRSKRHKYRVEFESAGGDRNDQDQGFNKDIISKRDRKRDQELISERFGEINKSYFANKPLEEIWGGKDPEDQAETHQEIDQQQIYTFSAYYEGVLEIQRDERGLDHNGQGGCRNMWICRKFSEFFSSLFRERGFVSKSVSIKYLKMLEENKDKVFTKSRILPWRPWRPWRGFKLQRKLEVMEKFIETEQTKYKTEQTTYESSYEKYLEDLNRNSEDKDFVEPLPTRPRPPFRLQDDHDSKISTKILKVNDVSVEGQADFSKVVKALVQECEKRERDVPGETNVEIPFEETRVNIVLRERRVDSSASKCRARAVRYYLDLYEFGRHFSVTRYVSLLGRKLRMLGQMTVGYWSEDVSEAFDLETLAFVYDADPSDSNTNHQSVAQIFGEVHSL